MDQVVNMVPSIIASHQTLNGMIAEAMLCSNLMRVLDVLERLKPVLIQHFGEEESATGPLEMLRGTPTLASAVERIRREHMDFIQSLDKLLDQTMGALSDDLCGDHRDEEIREARHDLMRFLDHLLDHEHFETVLYVSNMNTQARPQAAVLAMPPISPRRRGMKWGPNAH